MKKVCGEGCRGRGGGGDMTRCCVSGLGVSVWSDVCKISLRIWDVWVFWARLILAEFVFRCLLR